MAKKGFLLPSDDYPRLSLLAQFDDISRCSKQLIVGIEEEFKQFAESENGNRLKWAQAVKQAERLENEIKKYKKERDAFETKWKHLMNLMETEMQKRLKVEEEKKLLEKQITLVKEILMSNNATTLDDGTKEKLAFLNINPQLVIEGSSVTQRRLGIIEESVGSLSLLSSSDVSFDKTDDDIDNFGGGISSSPTRNPLMQRSRSKRGYAGHKKAAIKKKPKLDEDDCENYSQESLNHNEEVITSSKMPSSPRQSYPKPEDNLPDNMPLSEGQLTPVHIGTRSLPLRRCSSTKMNKAHSFCTKTVIRPETCNVCGHRVKFYKQALKCNDCKLTCHPECKSNVPQPCYPVMRTPTTKGAQGTIADYAPSTSPMVPSLIVHCINEIYARGMNEIGLYRISGSEREVRELKEKFLKGKSLPSLDKIDIHAICGTVKEFLRSLHEPLITRALWREFVNASQILSESEQFSAIKEAVSKLPQPNRDTLAFLLLHLRSVCESPECKMPMKNLATVFGPTIVGYTVDTPSDADMLIETRYQCAVMCALLRAPAGYWNEIIDSSPEILCTPEPRLEGNRLGPPSSSRLTLKSRGIVLGKTPSTPRCTPSGSIKSKRFFVSPLLK